jgi:hypothetical protein
MTREPKVITDAEDMLALLQADPSNRAIAYVTHSEGDEYRALVEVNESCFVKRRVAWLADEGTAHDLLEAACNADCDGDAVAWASLPVRYGPHCSTWVLAEGLHAPKKAGGDA